MTMSDYLLSRAFERWYDGLPTHERDQFDAYVRETVRVVRELADLFESGLADITAGD